ncbi:ATP-binding protein [Mycoplasmatota bacterium WC44]
MDKDNVYKHYENKVIELFENKYNEVTSQLELGFVIQFYIDGKIYHYVNGSPLNKNGKEDCALLIADNCYQIDFDEHVYKPSVDRFGKEFINDCFYDFYEYLESTTKDKFKVTYPNYNPVENKTTWITVNGFILERDDKGLPTMSTAVYYDIDEHKELQERLKSQNDLLNSQIQNFRFAEQVGNLGTFYVDSDKNPKKFWASDNYAIMMGLKVKKDRNYSMSFFNKILKEFTPIKHINNGEHISDLFYKFIKGDAEKYKITYPLKVDGKLKWFQSIGNSLEKDKKGKVVKYIGTVKDITELKENEIKLYNAKTLAEDDSIAKSNFLAHISHEIRTPLNAIVGYANLIMNEKRSNKIKDYSKKINYSSKILLKLINDVLDLSEITNHKLDIENVDFDFKKEVTQLIESFQIFVEEKDIKLVYYIDSKIPPLLNGDLYKIKQVISNLLNNCIKFTNKGFVSVRVNYVSLDNINKLNFEITDTGIGIEEKRIKDLFDPFIQADNSTTRKYGGTGLGLTICKELVEMMDGKISISSEVGRGTTFKFDISVNKIDSNIPLEKVIPLCASNYDRKILIVEDNNVNSLLIEELLKANNLKNITISVNGEEAIDEIRNGDFDIVLMDIQMPIMDGIEATKYIRKEFPNKKLRIIALTANVLKEQINEYISVGFDDYVSKPIDVNVLLNKIYG